MLCVAAAVSLTGAKHGEIRSHRRLARLSRSGSRSGESSQGLGWGNGLCSSSRARRATACVWASRAFLISRRNSLCCAIGVHGSKARYDGSEANGGRERARRKRTKVNGEMLTFGETQKHHVFDRSIDLTGFA